jgi:AraC-like DNA-binding protein
MPDAIGRVQRETRPGKCQACAHPDRAHLELLKAGGASLDSLAAKFGISRDSVHRHFKNHVSEARKKELLAGPIRVADLANAAAEESRNLLDYLSITRGVLFNQFLACAEAGDRHGVAHVGTQLLSSLRELGKLTGELRNLSGITINQNTLNVFADPDFLALQDGLVLLARKHPAIREDILQLLQGVSPAPTPDRPNGSVYPSPPLIAHEVAASVA